MKDITGEAITFYSAKDLANDLNISPVTLKKHSLLIEKLSEGAFCSSGTMTNQESTPIRTFY